MAKRRCLICGELGNGPRCEAHTTSARRTIETNRGRPSAHARGYTAEYRRNRTQLLASTPPCHWCGAPATTADHCPVPLVDGGGSDLDNLVPACARCNSSRGGRHRRM